MAVPGQLQRALDAGTQQIPEGVEIVPITALDTQCERQRLVECPLAVDAVAVQFDVYCGLLRCQRRVEIQPACYPSRMRSPEA